MEKIKNFFNETKFGKWAKETAIKTVKTMAETAIALITVDAFGITDVDWVAVGSASALSGVVTILFNIKNYPESENK